MIRIAYITVIAALFFGTSLSYASGIQGFTDFNGQPRAVTDLFSSDKWTVVMIWRHDCHVCNQEAAPYAFFHDGNERTQVVGLSMDGLKNKSGAERFIDNHDLPFPSLLGEPGAVAQYYQQMTRQPFRGTPSFLIFNPAGQLMAAQGSAVAPDTISKFIDSQSSKSE